MVWGLWKSYCSTINAQAVDLKRRSLTYLIKCVVWWCAGDRAGGGKKAVPSGIGPHGRSNGVQSMLREVRSRQGRAPGGDAAPVRASRLLLPVLHAHQELPVLPKESE